MRILLTTESIKTPLTGVGRYTMSLAQALTAIPEVTSLHYLSSLRVSSELPQPASRDQSTADVFARSTFNLRRMLSRSLFVQRLYVRSLRYGQSLSVRRARLNLVHGTNYWLPPCDAVGVLTVHDLSMYRYPQCHKPESLAMVIPRLEQGVRRASILLTPSECIRQEVAAYFAWPLSKVIAVPLGSSPNFQPQSESALASMLARRGLSYRRYSLYVGTIEPRKNLSCLLDAYEALPNALRQHYPLVIAGDAGWKCDDIHNRLQRARRQGWLRYLGYVPEADLAGLFAGARVFAYLSLYEGFGLPVLEALACGTPVVCSDAAALQEIVDDVALVSPVGDTARARQHLEQALTDSTWWDQVSQASLQRARLFSWQRTARETVAAYRQALNAGQDGSRDGT